MGSSPWYSPIRGGRFSLVEWGRPSEGLFLLFLTRVGMVFIAFSSVWVIFLVEWGRMRALILSARLFVVGLFNPFALTNCYTYCFRLLVTRRRCRCRLR